jgi:hypothetical protein
VRGFLLENTVAKSVLYVIPEGMDMGGIITSSEQLLCGFKEAGIAATFVLLRPLKTAIRRWTGELPEGYVAGAGSGVGMHPVKGWLPQGCVLSLGVAEDIAKFVRMAAAADVVVWGCAYGLRNAITEGNDKWLPLFTGHKTPHVMMIRDDHLQTRYPWAMQLEQCCRMAWAGVQKGSLSSLSAVCGPQALVYSGHPVPVTIPQGWAGRGGMLSIQTFKKWKNAHRYVAAVPHIPAGVAMWLAGDGIERRYMTSKDKCRESYYCTPTSDTKAAKRMIGKPIWENALAANMNYLGPIDENARDTLMRKCRLVVDLSYRQNEGQINRVVVEAMRNGAIPVCTNRFITGNDAGTGSVFVPGVHYLPIQHDLPPFLLAQQLAAYHNTTPAVYKRMHAAWGQLLPLFGRAAAAEQLYQLGRAAAKVRKPAQPNAAAARAFNEVFGGAE